MTSPTISHSRLRMWMRELAVARWLSEHPVVADLLLVTPFLVIAVLGMGAEVPTGPRMSHRPYDELGGALAIGSILAMGWRRRAPRLALLVNLVFTVPFLVLDYADYGSSFMTLLGLYTVAAHLDRRDALVVGGWCGAILLPIYLAGIFYEGEQLSAAEFIANVVIFVTAWVIGDSVRSRRALVTELQHRAEVAEQRREAEAERAVLDERARIAREMHDIVAHGLSVMIVQAGAARRVLDKRPDQAADALAAIEQTGRESMAEMRRLLGVLRDGAGGEDGDDRTDARPAPLTPQPGLAMVPALIEQWTGAGLPVDYHCDDDVPDLAPGVDVSAFRVIQEALTNTSKHAGPARAEVRVTVADDAVDIVVTDDGHGAAATPGPGSGHGLIGMQERVALYGGEVDAGPMPGGGFRVHAVLPLAGRSAPSGVPTSPG